MAAETVNLKTTLEAGSATLTWETPDTTNLLNWLVEVRAGSGLWTTLPLLEPSARSYMAQNLDPSVSYSFRVWAVVKNRRRGSNGVPGFQGEHHFFPRRGSLERHLRRRDAVLSRP
jgi:hypothetical protein